MIGLVTPYNIDRNAKKNYRKNPTMLPILKYYPAQKILTLFTLWE
jgi:hypothetical protein